MVFVVFAFILAAAMIMFNALFSQFYIPSSSMMNTFKINDRILVQNNTANSVQHGDIVVFTDPGGWIPEEQRSTDGPDYIVKRVIGLSGERVACCDDIGRNTVEGVSVDEPYIVGKNILSFDVVVPEGYIWVEGDNRENSKDSRYSFDTPGGAFVPISHVKGKVIALTWPFERFTWID